jgi:hypothetical protein
MIRTLTATALLFVAMAAPAFADTCQDDVAKLEQAMAQENLDADVKAQAEDMRSQAVQLCGAGNLDEGLAVTAEAKALLKVE